MRRVAAALLVIACGLLLGAGLAWVIGSLDDAHDDVAALRAQLLDIGATPVVGPSGERGAMGEAGVAGERGPVGPAGRDGRDGVDGQSPPCLFQPGQCVGPAGPAGRDGVDGSEGRDGVDGQDGTDGAAGPPGPQGPAGPSCPEGYSLQPDSLHGDDVLVCTREQP